MKRKLVAVGVLLALCIAGVLFLSHGEEERDPRGVQRRQGGYSQVEHTMEDELVSGRRVAVRDGGLESKPLDEISGYGEGDRVHRLRIVDQVGSGIPNASVAYVGDDSDGVLLAGFAGYIEFPGDWDDRWSVVVRGGMYPELTVDVGSLRAVDFVALAPKYSVVGRVLDVRGNPVSGATAYVLFNELLGAGVVARRNERNRQYSEIIAKSAANGSIVIGRNTAFTGELIVRKYGVGASRGFVSAQGDVGAGNNIGDIVLGGGGKLGFMITDKSGTPWDDLLVCGIHESLELYREEEHINRVAWTSARYEDSRGIAGFTMRTNAQGRIETSGMRTGRYKLAWLEAGVEWKEIPGMFALFPRVPTQAIAIAYSTESASTEDR